MLRTDITQGITATAGTTATATEAAMVASSSATMTSQQQSVRVASASSSNKSPSKKKPRTGTKNKNAHPDQNEEEWQHRNEYNLIRTTMQLYDILSATHKKKYAELLLDQRRRAMTLRSNNNGGNFLALLPSEVLRNPTISPFSYLDTKSIMIVSTLNKQSRAIVRGPGFEDLFRPSLFLSTSKDRENNHGRSVQLLQQLYRNREKLQQYLDATIVDFNNFHGNGLDRNTTSMGSFSHLLKGIETLTISSDSPLLTQHSPNRQDSSLYYYLPDIMPNIQQLTFTGAHTDLSYLLNLCKKWPLLTKLTFNDLGTVSFWSKVFSENLQELSMDDARFNFFEEPTERFFCEYFWTGIRSLPLLERLSLRNVTYFRTDIYHLSEKPTTVLPIPQQELMRVVRNAPPSLKWFRSDLTLDNITMLKKERPGIEFVS